MNGFVLHRGALYDCYVNSGRAYIDLDDVISATGEAFVEIMAQHYGREISLDDIQSWDLAQWLGLAEEEIGPFMERVHAPQTLGGMSLIDGAHAAMQQIREMGFVAHIVTGRPPQTSAITRDWLRRQNVPHDELIHVDKYGHNVPSSSQCRVLNLGDVVHQAYVFAVEDSGEMAAFLVEQGVPVALMDRAWNRGVEMRSLEEKKLIRRCSDWHGVLRWIEGDVHARR